MLTILQNTVKQQNSKIQQQESTHQQLELIIQQQAANYTLSTIHLIQTKNCNNVIN
jgi:hypothetical protein